ncbi:LysR family transcriptional regulator [Nonomuraea sp. 3-1Str]|uniref:LysR family transcriptional regulator n=1 Tax=Nonomuraea sp. 3-1Str TaxID=2929801 RepID=UPI00286261E7|nr:LysR family transcriptional regulator [Nonomuraea sp. 3-1Str]MDR8412998.1 LysR family transcriptional regulator [Nonomuraea sp. 3-1Str]
MVSMEQLVGFVAVAEELHYGRAAARLRMTQPPLSRRIQALERELGVELFDRTRRAVRLTPAGRAFLAEARKVLQVSQEAVLTARRTPRGDAGVVTLAFTATTAYSFLERVVTEAGARLPGVELVLREMVTAAQVEALLSGAVDVGMVRPPVRTADIRTAPLTSEPLLAALPDGHPLAVRAPYPSVADFDGEPFIMYSPSEARYFHEVLVAVFRTAGVQPVHRQYLSQVHTVLAMVKAGLGLALVPAAASALRMDGVVLRPVTGLGPGTVRLDLAWRAGNDNPVLAPLLRAIRRLAGDREGSRIT